jgi:hypothetical protein
MKLTQLTCNGKVMSLRLSVHIAPVLLIAQGYGLIEGVR